MTALPLEGYCTFRPTCKTLDYVLLNKHQNDLIISNTAVDRHMHGFRSLACIYTFENKLIERSRVGHNHKPQPTLDTKKSEVVTYSIPHCCQVAWGKCTGKSLAFFCCYLYFQVLYKYNTNTMSTV